MGQANSFIAMNIKCSEIEQYFMEKGIKVDTLNKRFLIDLGYWTNLNGITWNRGAVEAIKSFFVSFDLLQTNDYSPWEELLTPDFTTIAEVISSGECSPVWGEERQKVFENSDSFKQALYGFFDFLDENKEKINADATIHIRIVTSEPEIAGVGLCQYYNHNGHGKYMAFQGAFDDTLFDEDDELAERGFIDFSQLSEEEQELISELDYESYIISKFEDINEPLQELLKNIAVFEEF